MKKAFNRTSKIDNASNPLLGHQAFDRLKNIIPMYGKTQKKDGSHNNIWKKKSIFFDLPYRCDLHVRHFLDVMHVEKNVCDSLVGTLQITLKKKHNRVIATLTLSGNIPQMATSNNCCIKT